MNAKKRQQTATNAKKRQQTPQIPVQTPGNSETRFGTELEEREQTPMNMNRRQWTWIYLNKRKDTGTNGKQKPTQNGNKRRVWWGLGGNWRSFAIPQVCSRLLPFVHVHSRPFQFFPDGKTWANVTKMFPNVGNKREQHREHNYGNKRRWKGGLSV